MTRNQTLANILQLISKSWPLVCNVLSTGRDKATIPAGTGSNTSLPAKGGKSPGKFNRLHYTIQVHEMSTNTDLGLSLDEIIALEKATEATQDKTEMPKATKTRTRAPKTADKPAEKNLGTKTADKPAEKNLGTKAAPVKHGKVFKYAGPVEGDCIRLYTYCILNALVGVAVGKPFKIVDFKQFWGSPTAYAYLSGKGVFEPGNSVGTIVLTKTGVAFVTGRVLPKYAAQADVMTTYIRDGKALKESVKVNTGAFYKDVQPIELSYTPM